jgi:hypothetical protein
MTTKSAIDRCVLAAFRANPLHRHLGSPFDEEKAGGLEAKKQTRSN